MRSPEAALLLVVITLPITVAALHDGLFAILAALQPAFGWMLP